MNKFLSLAAALAVGSASGAIYAQSDSAPGGGYGKFRPLAAQQEAAAEQPAAQPAQEAPQAPAQPAPPAQPAMAEAVQAPAQVRPPMMGAPYGHGPGMGYGPGAGYGPGHMDPYGAHSWARYEERKRFMRDRHMFQRYAGPRRGYGRYSRFGPHYGGPAPFYGVPQGPAAAAPQGGEAPEAAEAAPGGY